MVEIDVNCEFYGENKESPSGIFHSNVMSVGHHSIKKAQSELWAMYLDIVYVQQ